ncbi:Retrovirus-related Pol polyprotein from transposon 297 [Vitis vinifera]|uniref:Retrovirus-related Pol polyprotein from transposon 297 n=1 Tax=Vitis vinifera TaxID=29760 RepID=A0A438EBV7_VITVI|nr:Retrovirus-related Pol polyprotein from transposon 297 [Vitis vinifera]
MASMGGYTSAFLELGGLQATVVGALWSMRRRGDVQKVFLSLVGGYYSGALKTPWTDNHCKTTLSKKTSGTKSEVPFRKLSKAKLQAKREKGLCYCCDDRFSSGHHCRLKELQVMVYQGEEELLERLTSPKTIKLKGKVCGKEVVVLIDPGATHNFVSYALVKQLEIRLDETGGYGVLLGTGVPIKGDGVCRGVQLLMQGVKTVKDFLPLNLGGSDLILGMQWLETLRIIKFNCKTLTMRFKVGESTVTLQGYPALCKTQVTLKALMRAVKGKEQGVLVEFINTKLSPKTKFVSIPEVEIERLVNELLVAGVIQPSSSPFSSPILLVKKKDDSWHFCVDYPALNRVIVSDKFPIPVIDELLDELNGVQIFSKLDLKSSYHQIRVKRQDIHKTAFRTHNGHYEFLIMSFGLMNAPSTFQSLMNDIFHTHLWKFVLVFFDDILVYTRDLQSHVHHFEVVFSILHDQKLFANMSKCHFAQLKLEYLGHIISTDGVAVDPSKIEAMQCYGKIAYPLTEQLKKDNFGWTYEAEHAFNQLKHAMMTIQVLALPDFNKPFVIETDASGVSVGAVLMQDQRLIASYSHILAQRNKLKSVYERELMAIVFAIPKDCSTSTFQVNSFLTTGISQQFVCQQTKYMAMSPAGLLQPLPIPDKVKYGHFIPLKHLFNVQSIVVLFIKEIVRLHGVPHSIISDHDKVFLSHFWSELFKLQGTILKKSSTYHPQIDGQSEAEYWYNTSYHTTTQSTPFWLLYGQDPPALVRYGHSFATVSSDEHMLEERDVILEELKLNLHKAQDRMRATANRKRREEHYDVGGLVYLKLQPYHQKSLAKRCNDEELSPHYYRPFPIEARVGTVAYRLTLPPSSTVHLVCHISQLLKAVGTTPTSPSLPPQLTAEMELLVEPTAILGVHQRHTGSTSCY